MSLADLEGSDAACGDLDLFLGLGVAADASGTLLHLKRTKADQLNLFQEIEKNGYSVREVEEIVRGIKEGNSEKPAQKKSADKKQDAVYHQLKKHLTQFFQTPVQLTCSAKGSGKISIKFKDESELERIISIFDKLKQ